MSFYSDPAFFICLAVALVPALVLGLMGRASKVYGLVVSVAFLVALFCRDLEGALYFCIFLVVSCACGFATLALFKREHPHRVALFRLLLVVALVPLASAKVTPLLGQNVLGFLGISYLTFKSVQVMIEVRDGLITEMSFADYLYFLLFFPVFTSGPIMRSRDFIAQLEQRPNHDEYVALIAKGAGWFVRGVLYSFVLGAFFNWLQWFAPAGIGTGNAGQVVLGQLAQGGCYGLYLFFDFAGYSLMAMGVGAVLGIRVPANFKAPFAAVDIKDFWDRWHITLSYWLRDYVFMRLTRTFIKHKTFKNRVTTSCVAFICNMGVMGVWHGLTVDYIVYGFYHGLLLAGCELWQKKSKFYKKHRKETWYKLVSWAVTMVAVFFGFALFSGQVTTCVAGLVG